MPHRSLLAMTFLSLAASAPSPADEPNVSRCFELRIYTAAEDKLDALNARFRDHTCKLFEKHGMENIGYWMPPENPDRKLYYVLAYPSREARHASWNDFLADPEWKAAAGESEKNGRLVTKVESKFLHVTDYSPPIEPSAAEEPRVFELRTYTSTKENLPRLHARFRDHTCTLFEKHGMTNVAYWTLDEGQPGADSTLVYLLAHKSFVARDASFNAFRSDPDWIAAREASEKPAGGSLTVKDGVKSVLLSPTDYSPMK